MRKILEIDEECDKILTAICDTALKAGGMQMHSLVNKLIEKIVHEHEAESKTTIE